VSLLLREGWGRKEEKERERGNGRKRGRNEKNLPLYDPLAVKRGGHYDTGQLLYVQHKQNICNL